MMPTSRTPNTSRPVSPTTISPHDPPPHHPGLPHHPDHHVGHAQPPPLNQATADVTYAAAAATTTHGNSSDQDAYHTFHTEILGHMQNQFTQVIPNVTTSTTANADTSSLPPQLVALITQVVSKAIMQIQPIIMDTVSQACSKMFVMMLDRMDRQNVAPQPPPGHAAPHTPATPLAIENSINIVMKKQLRQQSYITDQMEQDTRQNTVRIKGLLYEDQENLTQRVIDTAKDIDVELEPEDITQCFRLGGSDAAPDKRVVVLKLRSNRAKVALMVNKKKLTGRKYIEEDLTKLRMNLYHTVRMDRNTIKTWTVEGKICTIVKDQTGSDVKKIITTPEDLVRINWTEERISNFWDQFNG